MICCRNAIAAAVALIGLATLDASSEAKAGDESTNAAFATGTGNRPGPRGINTCGIAGGGVPLCWGANLNGQLGDGWCVIDTWTSRQARDAFLGD